MRRSVWFRSLASLLALWLPLVAGEPGLLQPCAMHGAGRLVMASLGGHAAAAPAPSAHGTGHAHHGAAAATQSNDSRPDHSHHQCSCIDGCAVAGTAFVAPAAPVARFAFVERSVERSVPSVESLARPAPEYSRPYTTGPPRA